MLFCNFGAFRFYISYGKHYFIYHNSSNSCFSEDIDLWSKINARFQITEHFVEKHLVNAAKDRTCVKLHLCQFLFSCMMFIFLDFFYSSITYCVHAFAVIFTPVQNAIVLSLTYWQKSRICLLSFVNRLSKRHFLSGVLRTDYLN